MAAKKPRKPRKKKQRVQPVCKSFLICDRVLFDQISRSLSLMGLFTQFTIRRFPAMIPSFWLSLQLFNGLVGEYPVEIEIQDLHAGAEIARIKGPPAIFHYRPEKYDVIVCVPPLLLRGPGKIYAVVAFVDGEPIAEQLFTIRAIEGDADGSSSGQG